MKKGIAKERKIGRNEERNEERNGKREEERREEGLKVARKRKREIGEDMMICSNMKEKDKKQIVRDKRMGWIVSRKAHCRESKK